MKLENYPFRLVTGTMRSGTTLLGELLQPRNGKPNHPQLLFCNDKSDFIRDLSKTIRMHDCENASLEDFRSTMPLNKKTIIKFLKLRFHFFYTKHGAERLLRSAIASSIFENTVKNNFFNTIGCKTTHLTQEIFLLQRLFSNFKAVIMIRDPRDVIASNIARLQSSHIYTGLMVVSTILCYDAIINSNPKNVLVVKYEDLVNSPESTLQQVLQWFDLSIEGYNWDYLKSVGSNSSYGQSRGTDIIPFTGIQKKSIGAYTLLLEEHIQYFINKILHGYIKRNGYQSQSETIYNPDAESFIKKNIAKQLIADLKAHGIDHHLIENKMKETGFI